MEMVSRSFVTNMVLAWTLATMVSMAFNVSRIFLLVNMCTVFFGLLPALTLAQWRKESYEYVDCGGQLVRWSFDDGLAS